MHQLVEKWLTESVEREARAANPEVVGVVERDAEEAVVRTLRRCAAELSASAHYAEEEGLSRPLHLQRRCMRLRRRMDGMIGRGVDPGDLRAVYLRRKIEILEGRLAEQSESPGEE